MKIICIKPWRWSLTFKTIYKGKSIKDFMVKGTGHKSDLWNSILGTSKERCTQGNCQGQSKGFCDD